MGKNMKIGALPAAVACCFAQFVMARPAYSAPVAAIPKKETTKHADEWIARMMVAAKVGREQRTMN
jgi:hypothetical protein